MFPSVYFKMANERMHLSLAKQDSIVVSHALGDGSDVTVT